MKSFSAFLLALAMLATVGVMLAPLTFASAKPNSSIWFVSTLGSDDNSCQSPTAPCSTITGANGKASAGDTIRVATGTYTGTGTEVILLNKDITLSGGWDAVFGAQTGATTLDGEGARRGATVSASTTVTIERFTIQNGSVSGRGGGIYNAGTLGMSDSAVQDNTAGDFGGGLYNASDTTAILATTMISGNNSVSQSGGGIYNAGTLTLTTCSVKNNNGMGVANIYNDSGRLWLMGSALSGGSSTSPGNGIYSMNGGWVMVNNSQVTGIPDGAIYTLNSILVITDSMLLSNTTSYSGAGIQAYNSIVTVMNSTLAGNYANGQGGGLSIHSGTVNLNNVTISGNTAADRGGGIYLDSGLVTVVSSTVINNGVNTSSLSDIGGGGIYNAGGTVMLSQSLVSRNTISSSQAAYIIARGAGVYNDGVLEITDSSLISNSVDISTPSWSSAAGAGIFSTGTLTLTNVSILGNRLINLTPTSYNQGSGVYNSGNATMDKVNASDNEAYFASFAYGGGLSNGGSGTLTLMNSTISRNHIVSAAAFDGGGGGIYAEYLSVVSITNTTIVSNTTNSFGGGIYSRGSLAVTNTTIVNNTGSSGGNIQVDVFNPSVFRNTIVASGSPDNCTGPVASQGHNLESGNTCVFTATGDLTNTNPLLGPLQDNGGATLTMALLPGSPAIDAGDNVNCPAADQRGFPRPVDGNNDGIARCDIGAVELSTIPVSVNGVTINGLAIASLGANILFTVTVNPITATQPMTYVWNATDFTPIGHNAGISDTHRFTWNIPGAKTITVTASNTTGIATGTYSILIGVPPSTVKIEGPTFAAAGASVIFTATSSPFTATQPITYTWDATDIGSTVHSGSISNTHSLTWSSPGVKTVTVTASNATGAATDTYFVLIGVPPSTVKLEGPTTGLVNSAYAFVASVNPLSVTRPITYLWEMSHHPAAAQTNGISDTIVLSWTTYGTHVVTVTVSNGFGFSVSSTQAIAIDPRRVYLPLILR